MLLGKCTLSCLHSGATCGISRISAETNSVTCLQHSYQHDAPNLTLIYVHVCNISG